MTLRYSASSASSAVNVLFEKNIGSRLVYG